MVQGHAVFHRLLQFALGKGGVHRRGEKQTNLFQRLVVDLRLRLQVLKLAERATDAHPKAVAEMVQ